LQVILVILTASTRHDVVATVRSDEKAAKIRKSYCGLASGTLTFAIVADVSSPNAFNEVVKCDPPLDAVIHTASPFHFNIEDPKDFLDPAIKGTIGLLNAIKNGAPTVKRVVGSIPWLKYNMSRMA
jgi:nucleoside-diphosphate-sugar epimerase